MKYINPTTIRADFPILSCEIKGKPLIYLDNAATTQKPKAMLDALLHYYTHTNANVHRGLSGLAAAADMAYARAREKVRVFINAKESAEIIFVRGATEAINLVAQSYGRAFLCSGDEVILTIMEHHSNIVPWQMLRDQLGIKIAVVGVNDKGELDLEEYQRYLARKPKLVAITHVSNVLGTVNPVKEMVKMAHAVNVPVLLDGAQAVGHFAVDVQDLDCDFYVFSGHKMYAPTGIGVLYGKQEFLEKMPPYQGGGGMIQMVSFAKTKYADLPEKFEAGTPSIADAVALGAAVDYLQNLTMAAVDEYEKILLDYATAALQKIEGLRILGTAANKVGVISFVLDNIHPHDVGTILDKEGITIRAGHHCAMPLLQHFNVPATTRVSFGVYNTKEEIDVLVKALAIPKYLGFGRV